MLIVLLGMETIIEQHDYINTALWETKNAVYKSIETYTGMILPSYLDSGMLSLLYMYYSSSKLSFYSS